VLASIRLVNFVYTTNEPQLKEQDEKTAFLKPGHSRLGVNKWNGGRARRAFSLWRLATRHGFKIKHK
jgi:hypothetical protein